MGVTSYDPESGTWDDEGTQESFNQNARWDPDQPEMGYKQPGQRPAYDQRDIPQTDLQIIPVTPTREEDRHRWNPGWKIGDVINNGITPPTKKPFLN